MQYSQQYFDTDSKLFYAWFEAMFTRIDIAICTTAKRDDLVEIVSEIERIILKYECIGNYFDPESEISKVNDSTFENENEISISTELCELLVECLMYNHNTMGYFDITVYSSVELKNSVDKYAVNVQNSTVKFLRKGVRLNLSGFLKGFVLGKIKEYIDNKNIESILINIGNSSILAKGNHPFGSGWKIRVPQTENECILFDECLTSSGNSDVSKWPIVNPKNGSITMNKEMVSVITKTPSQGEVLSKVAFLAKAAEMNLVFEQFNAHLI